MLTETDPDDDFFIYYIMGAQIANSGFGQLTRHVCACNQSEITSSSPNASAVEFRTSKFRSSGAASLRVSRVHKHVLVSRAYMCVFGCVCVCVGRTWIQNV